MHGLKAWALEHTEKSFTPGAAARPLLVRGQERFFPRLWRNQATISFLEGSSNVTNRI